MLRGTVVCRRDGDGGSDGMARGTVVAKGSGYCLWDGTRIGDRSGWGDDGFVGDWVGTGGGCCRENEIGKALVWHGGWDSGEGRQWCGGLKIEREFGSIPKQFSGRGWKRIRRMGGGRDSRGWVSGEWRGDI